MTDNEEITVVELPSTDVIYNQDKAIIDSQVATAKAYPRNIKKCVDNAIAIVTMDRETAEAMTYAIPRGGKFITGRTVHLAKVLAQCFGNMRIESKITSVDDRTLSSQGIAFDLENNIAIKVEVKRSIMTKYGRMSDDMIVVTGNAANAIALRNAVLSTIPTAIADKVHDAAKNIVIGDVSTPEKLAQRRDKILSRLKETCKVDDADILKAIGKKSIDRIDKDDLVAMVGIGQAIKDGDTTVDQVFKNSGYQRPAYKVMPDQSEKESKPKDKDKPAVLKAIKTKADLVKAYNDGLLTSEKYNELLKGFMKKVELP